VLSESRAGIAFVFGAKKGAATDTKGESYKKSGNEAMSEFHMGRTLKIAFGYITKIPKTEALKMNSGMSYSQGIED
jgi:hypothetical protein